MVDKKLLNEGFERYTLQKIVEKGQIVGVAEVAGGEEEYVQLVAVENFYYPLSGDERTKFVFSEPGFEYAPVVAGTPAGVVYICVGDVSVGACPVVFGETVEQEKVVKKSIWQKIFRS